MNKATAKYLMNYAEPLPFADDLIAQLGDKAAYKAAVIIPVHRELESLPKLIKSMGQAAQLFSEQSSSHAKTLAILVINASSHHAQQALAENTETLNWLAAIAGEKINLNHGQKSFFGIASEQLDLVVLDYSSGHRHQTSMNVGRARKTAADLALLLYSKKYISTPWICSTDADVELPLNYFTALFTELTEKSSLAERGDSFSHTANTSANSTKKDEVEQGKVSAKIVNFHHDRSHTDPLVNKAIDDYEFFLRYYTTQMQRIASPYAFTAIGSTIVFHLDAYANVRGFPCLAAGEDFHFLNKMAKCGLIINLKEPVIAIKTRLSDRVPFGTGPALLKISEDYRSDIPYHVMSPFAFDALAIVLRWADLHFENSSLDCDQAYLTLLNQLNQLPLMRITTIISEGDRKQEIEEVIRELKIPVHLKAAFSKSRNPVIRKHHFHCSFDGLQSFKFLRRISTACFLPVPRSDL